MVLAHTGPISSLLTPPHSLAEPASSQLEPDQDTSTKVPTGGAGEASRPTSAEQNGYYYYY